MNCKICGNNNPDNAERCFGCGAPLPVNGNSGADNIHNQNRKTDGTLVAVLLVLALVLVGLVGVYVFNVAGLRRGGSGASPTENREDSVALSTSTPIAVSTPMPTPVPTIAPTIQPIPTPIPTPIPIPTPQPYEANMAIKDGFLEKARQIRSYSENYLETAGTQYELNNESQIVYRKWDELLNEVYQYLKSTMTVEEFKMLQQEELAWVHEKESAIERAGAEWAGGSGEPMARNVTGIEYTEERCYYLISLIN